jgi:hypothetical protein
MRDHDSRGVSNVLGLVLLFAIVIAGVVVVVTVGVTALDATRGELDTGRAEKALTQFDSRSAMVALGGTSHQGVDLAAADGVGYGVDPEAGWMNVTAHNETADEHKTLVNATLGAVVYGSGDESIAYQGGGVWQRTESGVRMLSPPEFHFRDQTLTLPIITVDGDRSIGGSAEVTRAGPSTIHYPNASTDDNFTNPLDSGQVNVTVHSEYYEAWGGYFEQRTQGNVSYDHEAETARIELVVPFKESYDKILSTTTSTVTANPGPPPDHETNVNYPSPDQWIDDQIDECESGGCISISNADQPISSGGTYWRDGDFDNEITVTNPGSDVTFVINGQFKPDDIVIDSLGDNNVTILVKNSMSKGVQFGGGTAVNRPGNAGDLAILVHSDVESIKNNGNYRFGGLLYAPGADCRLDGGGGSDTVEGALVCKSFIGNGEPGDYTYDPDVNDIRLNLSDEITPITYLHVTENPINITSG